MYICVCKSITEEMLNKALKTSKNSSEALKKLGVGDDCGICVLNKIETKEAAISRSDKKSK